ncbi:hypothetical protein QSE00_05190 [Arenibacter sp. M-2]|uniref:hypothetical protein n=1 Tax=Arenibacter sp. M-2 TaxID=3053612 RepID=UPI002570AE5D|nr:hypothetical protein [Arenibacter sp. M-2]MDL5511198.1 hypothetical protein [Arenibacter sp. M-2]
MKIRTKKWLYFLRILIFPLFLIVLISAIDFVRISSYEITKKRKDVERVTEGSLKCEEDEVYYDLVNGKQDIDWGRLEGTLEYSHLEYDLSDFHLVNLIRILYEYGDRIPDPYLKKIEDSLFDFRYWWDEPGENGMCYWSENHQILFASAEYLIGQKYPEALFPRSGLTGSQHKEKARKRILDWLEMRWNYGFTEFYSAAYYPEDMGALINIIDLSEDDEVVDKCRIILDLLMYDVASQTSSSTMFVSVTGRAYERGRTGAPWVNSFRELTNYYWGDGKEIDADMIFAIMRSNRYRLPPVFTEIAMDSSNVVIKQCNGLDLPDLKKEGYYGLDDRSMMMQWGMECFTNPEIIRNTMAQIRKCNMFSNKFLADTKYLDFTLIKALHLEPLLSKALKMQSNGAAIQQGNTYTYRTKDYSLYTVMKYHPGTYGSQQHVAGMNIGNHFSIFHMYPARSGGSKDASPGYWVGYGHLPYSVQDQNVNLSIYNTPEKKAIMELDLIDFTHAYFPETLFDTTHVANNYAFGKKDETYSAFIGTNDFIVRDKKDIIQPGKKVFWITEAGSKYEDGSFDLFIQRIKNNRIEWDSMSLSLTYQSLDRNYHLKFDGDFTVDDQVIDSNYNRYDSPYVRSGHRPETIEITHNGKSLFLDFKNMIREIR